MKKNFIVLLVIFASTNLVWGVEVAQKEEGNILKDSSVDFLRHKNLIHYCMLELFEKRLFRATEAGDIETVESILQVRIAEGALKSLSDVEIVGNPEVFILGKAIHHAVEEGYQEIVKLFLGAGTDPNHVEGGETLLIKAALGNHPEMIKLLVEAGGDPNQGTDFFKRPPLFFALKYSRAHMIEPLLQVGADPFLRGKKVSSFDPPMLDVIRRAQQKIRKQTQQSILVLIGQGMPPRIAKLIQQFIRTEVELARTDFTDDQIETVVSELTDELRKSSFEELDKMTVDDPVTEMQWRFHDWFGELSQNDVVRLRKKIKQHRYRQLRGLQILTAESEGLEQLEELLTSRAFKLSQGEVNSS